MRSNIVVYLDAIAPFKRMLKLGLITPEEYIKIEEKLYQKYGLNSSSIYRQIT